VAALVGYTNAGKSTLFNRLASAEVLAKDVLFATLDPTMRVVKLPSGRKIILSDTVGFIADLPTQLVAAFRATLEEVLNADVILHIRDAAHDETEAQKKDVMKVLADLGVDSDERPIVEVLNKIDLIEPDVKKALLTRNRARASAPIAVSALTGEGTADLLNALDRLTGQDERVFSLKLAHEDGAGLAWAYAHGRVLERKDRATGIHLSVAIDPQDINRFVERYGEAIRQESRVRRAS
jgi:GTP-binding protein HflX